VVNKEVLTYGSSGVNFYIGQEAVKVRQQPGRQPQPVPPEEISQSVKPQGMKAGIAGYDLGHTPGGRVFGKYGFNIFPHGLEQV
jgi:hypothetical protein